MGHRCLWLFVALLTCSYSTAQDDDELPSGLLATYSTKNHTVQLVDPDIAFTWDKAAPDERLAAGPFTAKWTGRILLRGEVKTRWHAFVQGKVEVRIDDKIVVRGETEQPAWVSGDESDLGFGEKPLAVTFTRAGEAAQLKLFWSSNDFPLEPLPYHILFHEPPAPEIALAARGRVLFEAHRCANCHGAADGRGLRVEGQTKATSATVSSDLQPSTRNLQPFLPAPSLKHVGQGTSRAWLIEKVMGSHLMSDEKAAEKTEEKTPHPSPLPAKPGRGDKAESKNKDKTESKMPHFGFTQEEAEAVVAALIEQAQPVKLDAPPKLKDSDRDKDLKEGRTLIRSVGCLACHTHDTLGEATPFGGGPLTDIGQRRSADWLATWLAKPSHLNEHARMPVVTLSDKERAQIVLALLVPSPPSAGERARVRGPDGGNGLDKSNDSSLPPSPRRGGSGRGDDCQTTGPNTKDDDNAVPLPNPPRRGEGIKPGTEAQESPPLPTTEAAVPESRGQGTGKEKAKGNEEPLTLTLSPQSRGEGTRKEDPAQVALGRKLIESSRCSACHEFSRQQPLTARPRSLARGELDWTKSCVQTTNVQPGQPKFSQVDEKAIRAYVGTWDGRDPSYSLALDSRLSTLDPAFGRRLLEQKNCLACHDRDESKGLSRLAATFAKADESLAGLHMTLIPPRLHAVGDRMHDTALAEAIQGGPKNPRLSWLRVRMPRYQHTEIEKSALMAYLIGHDRIPERVAGQPQAGVIPSPPSAGERARVRGPNGDNANDPQNKIKETPHPNPLPSKARGEGTKLEAESKPDPQRLLAGRELLGGKGFSCVACHAVKDYTPKVTALGTRGSNLHLLGQRMRTDYYFRWTRAPLRIMPGVEMPNYQRPHEFILPGQLDQQLTAIWEALNDPNLTSPTNPAVVEQLLTVNKGERPRIARDVFTVPGGQDGETVPRAFAIGFDNGHSVLFDLDTGSVRAWTLGDFARQRCEGKRWYWDLAGTALASGFDKQSELLFLDNKSGEVISPETGWNFETNLKTYHDELFVYQLTVTKGDETHSVHVHNDYHSDPNTPSHGWTRIISVSPAPTFGLSKLTVTPWHRGTLPETLHSTAGIRFEGPELARPQTLPATARPFAKHPPQAPHTEQPVRFKLSIHYTTTLERVEAASPNPPAPSLVSSLDRITSVPGFRGERLPLPRSIMPTAMTFDNRGRLIFTSLKGHVFRVDSDVAKQVPQNESGEPKKDLSEETKLKTSASTVKLTTLAEGLAAPFGVMWYPQTSSMNSEEHPQLLVAHKPELLVLFPDRGEYEIFNRRWVLATGWGITDDYHDWTCGPVWDSRGNLLIGLASDYTFKNRPKEKSRWRGDILRINPKGEIESIAHGLRYPTGLAIDDQDRLFVTDQQGVQNTFNELNYIQPRHRYGVPSRHEPEPDAPADPPAVQIPHPWTRSVNGLVFVPTKQESGDRKQESGGKQPQSGLVPSPPPVLGETKTAGERARVRGPNGDDAAQSQPVEERTPHPNPLPSKARGEGTRDASLALDSRHSALDSLGGHFLAVEYNNNSIIRLSVQDVDGVVQGAVYPFSRPTSAEAPLSATPNSGGKPLPQDSSSLIGPICIGISPAGDIYVGGFQDGGWAGGLNMGDIVKLTPGGPLPNGLREIRATSRGFDLEFFHPVDAELARQASQYKISGYTRVWKGDYATPDSGRHTGEVTDAKLDAAARTVSLTVKGLKPGHVYDVSVGEIGRADQRTLWPAIGHYTLHRVPQ